MSIKFTQDYSIADTGFRTPSNPSSIPSSVWRRNPAWSTLPTVLSTDQKIVILKAVFPKSDFVAFNFAGNYTVDWGDGTVENFSANTQANHQYSYTNTNLDNTDGPVTFTDAGDLVTRTSHSYVNGDTVSFSTITSTTGITVDTPYYVVNATANTFQLSTTSGGSAIALTTNGSGTLLPYKQAVIIITPQSGQNLTIAKLFVLNTNTSARYETGFLDMNISIPNVQGGNLFATPGNPLGSVNNIPTGLMIERFVLNYPNVTSFNRFFEAYHNLQSVSIISNNSSLTDMTYMFVNCFALESVSLFDTANVTTMEYVFYGCYSLTSVPLFNTINVTSMYRMFIYCYSLKSVPLFNTVNVTNMNDMFYLCHSFRTVPLFNTRNVTDMQNMFYLCYCLRTVPAFPTRSVTTMRNMFNNNWSLQSVPLFNTSNVTDMAGMFAECYSLQTVPLFDTSKVTDMIYMFYLCRSLKSVPLFDTRNVTDMTAMFQSAYSLTSVPLFNTVKVTTMQSMFYACHTLRTVPLFNTANVTNMNTTFQYCYPLKTVPLFNTINVTNMNSTFAHCYSLKLVSSFNTANVTDIGGLFYYCRSLESSPFNTRNVTYFGYMFDGCYNIKLIPSFNTANAVAMDYMFQSCVALKEIPSLNCASISSSTGLDGIVNAARITRSQLTNVKYTHSYADQNLANTELNEIYTNLPTVVGQTITVTGNWGTANDDPTIATAKGWTVTG